MSAEGSFPVLDPLKSTPRVYTALLEQCREDRVSHAILFCAPTEATARQAAFALTQALVCPYQGDGSCADCQSVLMGSHPDVQELAPASDSGYSVTQIRELARDAAFAPVRSRRRIYVLNRAECLSPASANALLKILEEPPGPCVFMLLSSHAEDVLETLRSRCQVFSLTEASFQKRVEELSLRLQVSQEKARIALAITCSSRDAESFLRSDARQSLRRSVILALSGLAASSVDGRDVLVAADGIYDAAVQLADSLEGEADVGDVGRSSATGSKTTKAKKQKNTSLRRWVIMEVIACVRSVLGDGLQVLSGSTMPLVHADMSDCVYELVKDVHPRDVCVALEAAEQAVLNLRAFVDSRVTVEVMLLRVWEALYVHRYSGEV